MHQLSLERRAPHSGRHLMASGFRMSPAPTGTKGGPWALLEPLGFQIWSALPFKLINCTPVELQINARDGSIVWAHLLLGKISPNISGGHDAQNTHLKWIHPTETWPDQRHGVSTEVLPSLIFFLKLQGLWFQWWLVRKLPKRLIVSKFPFQRFPLGWGAPESWGGTQTWQSLFYSKELCQYALC